MRREKRDGIGVGYAGEEEPLMGKGVDAVAYRVAFACRQVGRAFGDYDDVGTTAATAELAEVAKGKDMVVDIEVAVLGEEDIEVGRDLPVLVAVVEQNGSGGRGLGVESGEQA